MEQASDRTVDTGSPSRSAARRELNNGFGEALAKAFELAVTPAIFAFLGHLLDRRLGTSPLFHCPVRCSSPRT